VWIDPQLRAQAESQGYQVVDPANVLIAHLTETVRRHGDELLNRDATKHLIDELRKTSPAVVDELIPGQMKLAEVQQVLQLLLREQVSIRQLAQILEVLGEESSRVKDPIVLCERVRRRLARAISARYRDKQGRVAVVTLDPALEEQLRRSLDPHDPTTISSLSPHTIEVICQRIAAAASVFPHGRTPVLLVSSAIRPAVKQMTLGHLPQLVVLSYDDVTRDTQLESLGMIALEAVAA
jgi:flagellar biosynthesis protein FlhA